MTFVYAPHNSLASRFDPKRCAAAVADGGRSVFFHQCKSKPVAQEEGRGWCKAHVPSVDKARRDAAATRVRAELDANERKYAILAARARVVVAAKAWADDHHLSPELLNAVAELKRLEAEVKS